MEDVWGMTGGDDRTREDLVSRWPATPALQAPATRAVPLVLAMLQAGS